MTDAKGYTESTGGTTAARLGVQLWENGLPFRPAICIVAELSVSKDLRAVPAHVRPDGAAPGQGRGPGRRPPIFHFEKERTLGCSAGSAVTRDRVNSAWHPTQGLGKVGE